MAQNNATRQFTLDDLRARCAIVGECWVWQGHTNKQGYGRIKWGGKRSMTTHRLAFAVANDLNVNDLPPSVVIRHTCDNPPCVNPDHLLAGTHADNCRDKIERGRDVGCHTPRTHCPHGHPYDEANVYITSRGWRACRACHIQRCRDYYYNRGYGKGVNRTMTPIEPDAPEGEPTEPDDD